ncbi:MAG: purine-binding chemotaxis protein CheW [Lachnospiraceae bacterium]|nr:purine-binding chemotaxis protein CheW [Lachnospiraceae bacterium]
MANSGIGKTITEEQNDRIQFVKIRLGSEWYGISIDIVENIVRMQRITRVPGAESYIKGVINLRGKVVPVMSLRLKMGMDEGETVRTTRIIILRIDGDEVGMIVDEVREVVTLTGEDIEEVYRDSKTTGTVSVSGIGKIGNDLISLLDMYEVLGVKNA